MRGSKYSDLTENSLVFWKSGFGGRLQEVAAQRGSTVY